MLHSSFLEFLGQEAKMSFYPHQAWEHNKESWDEQDNFNAGKCQTAGENRPQNYLDHRQSQYGQVTLGHRHPAALASSLP